MIDFIIVGRGLAAGVIAHTLHEEKISFKIIAFDYPRGRRLITWICRKKAGSKSRKNEQSN